MPPFRPLRRAPRPAKPPARPNAALRLATLAPLALAACGGLPSLAPPPETAVIRVTEGSGPPQAAPGSCWGQIVTPAVIETVTENILLQPAEVAADGTLRSPAVYKSETRQRIVQERRDLWFETLCEEEMTPGFIASLQRALAVRGAYRGPVTGELDARTRRAIRLHQGEQGLNSDVLSLAAARALGLAAVADPRK